MKTLLEVGIYTYRSVVDVVCLRVSDQEILITLYSSRKEPVLSLFLIKEKKIIIVIKANNK